MAAPGGGTPRRRIGIPAAGAALTAAWTAALAALLGAPLAAQSDEAALVARGFLSVGERLRKSNLRIAPTHSFSVR